MNQNCLIIREREGDRKRKSERERGLKGKKAALVIKKFLLAFKIVVVGISRILG